MTLLAPEKQEHLLSDLESRATLPLDLATLIMYEVSKREAAPEIVDVSFPKQAAFILDKARLVAGFCTRRAGKSYGIGLKMVKTALDFDGVSIVYIGLTRESAKRIIFKDILSVINRKHNLGIEFNKTELSATFPNGSVIYVLGMDSTPEESQKVLGQKFKLAVIDEAGSFRQDLFHIVYGILKPATADLKGQIILIGTPQPLTKGLFYDVVWSKKEPGWSVHRWTAHDNPYMAEQWAEEIEEMTAANPRITETPWFKQNYLGEYVIDPSQLVYKYSEERNLIRHTAIPELEHYVFGIDLGWTDASAISVLGYRSDSKKLYVVEVFKKAGLNLGQLAGHIRHLEQKYKPYKMFVDNAAKQAVEELKSRYTLPLTAAEKTGKADFIEIMNTDFITGNILVSDLATELSDEYLALVWDEKSSRREEHPNCENHAADATLYAWRACYQYASVEPPKPKTIEEKEDEWLEKQDYMIQTKKKRQWWET